MRLELGATASSRHGPLSSQFFFSRKPTDTRTCHRTPKPGASCSRRKMRTPRQAVPELRHVFSCLSQARRRSLSRASARDPRTTFLTSSPTSAPVRTPPSRETTRDGKPLPLPSEQPMRYRTTARSRTVTSTARSHHSPATSTGAPGPAGVSGWGVWAARCAASRRVCRCAAASSIRGHARSRSASGRPAAASAAARTRTLGPAPDRRRPPGRRVAGSDLVEIDVEDQMPGRGRGRLDVAAPQPRQRPAYGAGPPERAAVGSGAVGGRRQLRRRPATSWPGRRSALCRASAS